MSIKDSRNVIDSSTEIADNDVCSDIYDAFIRQAEYNKLLPSESVRIRTTNGTGLKGHDIAVTFDNGSSLVEKLVRIDCFMNECDTSEDQPAERIMDYLKGEPQKTYDLMNTVSYEDVKAHIIPTLIKTKGNEHLLSALPHGNVCDMSVIFKVTDSLNPSAFSTLYAVTYDMLRRWSMGEDAFIKSSLDTAAASDHQVVKPLARFLFNPEELDDTDEIVNNTEAHIMRTVLRYDGSGAIVYPGCLRYVADSLSVDYLYVLPSSVHETVLVHDKDADPDKLLDLVINTNASVVDSDEYLTDSLYRYDTKDDMLKLIKTKTA